MSNGQLEERSNQRTLQQERAASAWKDVNEVNDRDFKKEYASLVRGLPALIQRDGLGQTCAFLLAKAKNKRNSEHGFAYRHMATWVMAREFPKAKRTDLLDHLIHDCTSSDYRRATTEALAYVSWLKRFAEAKGWED